MSNRAKEDILTEVDNLFKKTKELERIYDWDSEIEILKVIEKLSLENNLRDIEGEVYFRTLRNKLITIIHEVEDFYREELELYSGDMELFSKISKFVHKIFGK